MADITAPQEGDYITGKGTLMPDGTYSGASSPSTPVASPTPPNPVVPTTPPAPVTPPPTPQTPTPVTPQTPATPQQVTQPTPSAPAIKPAPVPIKDANGQYYFPSSGQGNFSETTGSGRILAYDSQGNPVYANSAPNSNPTGVTANGSTGNADVDALSASYKAQAQAATTFSTAVQNIENGTTPLNPGEQAQVDGLRQQFDKLIQTQGLVNTNNTNTAQIRGFQTGTAEFDRGFQSNTIASVISAGANKIANLQTQEASAVATLTQSLQNNDIANLKTAYQALTDAQTATQNGLKTVIADTQGAMKDAAIQQVIGSGVTDPKDILAALQKAGYTDISSSDIASTIQNLSPYAAQILTIAQQAATNGASPEVIQAITSASSAAQALQISANSNVANASVMTLAEQYPDAGIIPGDTIQQANAKVQQSPSYTLAQKSAAADLAYKQAQTEQLISSINPGGNINGSNSTPVVMTADNTPNQAQQATFLAALPSDLATLVKGIANYQINPSSVPTRNYRGVGGLTQSQVLTLVSQYDPTFSQQNYASRQSLLTNFTSGKYSQNINALNTAVGHISDIMGNFQGLGNTGLTPYNYAKNTIASIFGSGEPGRANLNIQAGTSELATVFKGSGATDQEISALGTLSANSSPDQVKAYIETATQLLSSRLQALQDTYTSGMGKAPTNSFLSTTSQQQLLKLQQSGLNIKVPQLAQSPYVKIQTFHDASSENATLLDGIMANHPEFQSNPQTAIDYLNQQGINL